MPRVKKQKREKMAESIARLKEAIDENPGLRKCDLCILLNWSPQKFAMVRRFYHDEIKGPWGGNPILVNKEHRYYFDEAHRAEEHHEWIRPRNKAIRNEVERLSGTNERSKQLHPDGAGVAEIEDLNKRLFQQVQEQDVRITELEEALTRPRAA